MQVLFKSRHPQATDLRDLTESRVRFVLRRLGWLVPRAEVQLSDVNGPRGGIDKRCQVELRTDGGGSVVVTSVASDWRTALDNALARALEASGFTSTGPAVTAQYNPPWTPPPLRRNEILVPVR